MTAIPVPTPSTLQHGPGQSITTKLSQHRDRTFRRSLVDAAIAFHTYAVFLCLHWLHRRNLESVLQRDRPSTLKALMVELGNSCYSAGAYAISCLGLTYYFVQHESSHPRTWVFGLLAVMINVEGLLSVIFVSIVVSAAKHTEVLYTDGAYTLMLEYFAILLAVPPSSFVWSTLAIIPLFVMGGPSSSTLPSPSLFTRREGAVSHHPHPSQHDSPVHPAYGTEDIPPTSLSPLVLMVLSFCFLFVSSRFVQVTITVIRLQAKKGDVARAMEDLEAGGEADNHSIMVETDACHTHSSGARTKSVECVHPRKTRSNGWPRRRFGRQVSQISLSVNEDGVDSETDWGDASASDTSANRSCTNDYDTERTAYESRLELDLSTSWSLDWNAAVF